MGTDEPSLAVGTSNSQSGSFTSSTNSAMNLNNAVDDCSTETVACQKPEKAVKKVAEYFKIARDNRYEAVMARGYYSYPWDRDTPNPLYMPRFIFEYHLPVMKWLAPFYVEKIRLDLQWSIAAARCYRKGEPIKSWSKFDREVRESKRLPLFTMFAIAACILIHCYRVCVYDEDEDEHFNYDALGEAFSIRDFGEVERGEIYRYFTKVFIHQSWQHIIGNMLGLYLLGHKIEQIHGPSITGTIFAIGAAGGSMAHIVLGHQGGLQGASGGVYALLGAVYADVWTNWDLFEADNTYKFICFAKITTIARAGLLLEFMHHDVSIAHFSHFGGFGFGFCLSLPLLKWSRSFCGPINDTKAPLWSRILWLVCVLGGLTLFLFMDVRIRAYSGSPPLLSGCFEL